MSTPQQRLTRFAPVMLPQGGMSDAVTIAEPNEQRTALKIAFDLFTATGQTDRNALLFILLNYEDGDGTPGPERNDYYLRPGDTVEWERSEEVPQGRVLARYVDYSTDPEPAEPFQVRVHEMAPVTNAARCSF
ncbi:MAG: hypothetical protein AAFQ53_17865 [Bacteroidota bacterium]